MKADKKVQKIFNKVIEAGLYSDKEIHFMCLQLHKACEAGIISFYEATYAQAAINRYLSSCFVYRTTLYNCLKNCKLRYSPSACLYIYQNWDKRPDLSKPAFLWRRIRQFFTFRSKH